jgi:hypothetical protein
MALLSIPERERRFKFLGLEYNEAGIRKLQKQYLRKQDVDGIYGIDTDRLLRHVYNVKKVTRNFEPEEFKCECGGRYCTGYPSYMKQVELKNLQSIRSHYGKPMKVTCGLRCRTYNNKIAGSISNSKHLTGYATDFYMSGVTDTLANRKASIKWIKKLPNHNYTYGNGINSNGYAVYAPYMGNALHTDTNKPKVKPAPKKETKVEVNKIGKCAYDFAYKTNTNKADYPSGAPKKVYSEALAKVYPNHTKWGTAPSKGASCDVFVGTCVRSAGVDKDFPRGLDEQIAYLPKSKKFTEVKVTTKTVKDGDIVVYAKTGGGAHICIAYGGKIKEAGYQHYYPKTTNYLKQRLSKKGKKWLKVYRAK